MRELEKAMFNTQGVLSVDAALIERIKGKARAAPEGQYRLCLHHSTDDPVQEMIITQSDRVFFPPHCHPETSVSVHLLEGRLAVVVFDASGRVLQKHDLRPAADGGTFCLWLEPGCWHMNLPRSPMVVFQETMAGPFIRDRANIFPAWAPDPASPQAVRAFLESLKL